MVNLISAGTPSSYNKPDKSQRFSPQIKIVNNLIETNVMSIEANLPLGNKSRFVPNYKNNF